jgi:predicted glutamine amidotransferase
MCRILGFSLGANKEDLDAGEIAAILFPALVGQGPHAYGWMSYDGDTIEHQKFPGRCDTKAAWENILENVDPNAQWFVGHTRFATHGSPENNINNHPVPHRNLIGVHNGVLSNHEEILSVTGREDPTCEVDSEAIFAAVNKWGPMKGLRKLRGSLVTVYADRRKARNLYIGRTSGRQLTLGWTTKGNLFFASEQQALMKLSPEIKFAKFSTVSENRLLIIHAGKIISRRYFIEPKVSVPKKWVPRAMSDGFASSGPMSLTDARPTLAPIDGEIARLTAYNNAQRRVAERRGAIVAERLKNAEKKPTNTVPESLIAPESPPPATKKAKRKARKSQAAQKRSGVMVQVRGEWVPKEEWEGALARAEDEARRDGSDILATEEQHRSWFHTNIEGVEEFNPGIVHGD